MASFSAASPKDSNSSSFAKQHILSCSFQWLPQLVQSSAAGLCPHFHGHQWDWTKLTLEKLSFSPITLFGNRCISNKEKSLSINKHFPKGSVYSRYGFNFFKYQGIKSILGLRRIFFFAQENKNVQHCLSFFNLYYINTEIKIQLPLIKCHNFNCSMFPRRYKHTTKETEQTGKMHTIQVS